MAKNVVKPDVMYFDDFVDVLPDSDDIGNDKNRFGYGVLKRIFSHVAPVHADRMGNFFRSLRDSGLMNQHIVLGRVSISNLLHRAMNDGRDNCDYPDENSLLSALTSAATFANSNDRNDHLTPDQRNLLELRPFELVHAFNFKSLKPVKFNPQKDGYSVPSEKRDGFYIQTFHYGEVLSQIQTGYDPEIRRRNDADFNLGILQKNADPSICLTDSQYRHVRRLVVLNGCQPLDYVNSVRNECSNCMTKNCVERDPETSEPS